MDLLSSRDGKYIAVILALGGLLWMAGNRVLELDAALAARPTVIEASVDARTEDFRRGPVKITRRTVTAPDGTKTTEQTREIASETRRTEASSIKEHKEAPAQARARSRYVGLGIAPLDYARFPRLRAGLTLFAGTVDAGVAYDPRLPLTGGAMQIEAAYRF